MSSTNWGATGCVRTLMLRPIFGLLKTAGQNSGWFGLRAGATPFATDGGMIKHRRGSDAGVLDGEISMPIKSKAQRRKFAELLVKGEISPETFEEWNRAAGSAELPERLHPKVVVKQKRKVKSKRAPKSKTARAKEGTPRKRG